ncbi:MAG: hypothetical protein K2R98_24425 [Gemmataceae bacterium]|nr:hypothetical protein [Gemmataceae bacterium]
MANPEAQPELTALIRCPRCPVKLQRSDMVKHLWLQHRLLLDGNKAREPWPAIEEWIAAYHAGGDRKLLARCFEVARHVDPEGGPTRVRQLLTIRVDDGPAPADLFAEAEQRGASLCSHCFGLVTIKAEAPPARLNLSHGRMSWSGYVVEVSEQWLFPRLTIQTPDSVVFQNREPDSGPARRGLFLLLVWPPVLLALLLAAIRHVAGVAVVLPVVLLLVVALTAGLFVHFRTLARAALLDRAIDAAWSMLSPRLHVAGFEETDASFLAGLAVISVGHGQANRRERTLERVIDLTEKAVLAGTGSKAHLAALVRLALTDAATAGSDPVTLVARQISRCLEGVLPLACGEQLLARWESAWWTVGNLARLRVLVCERAFEAGFTVGDLQEVGRLAPALGDVLETDQPDALAQLRFLWSIRSGKPWARCGEALTVFELTQHAAVGARWLENHPDLLLSPVPTSSGGPALQVCARGVLVDDKLLMQVPASVEVRGKQDEDGYELIVGDHVFALARGADALARRLERWCHYYFGDFLPQAMSPAAGRASPVAERLRAREAVACPDCRQQLLPRRGDVGAMSEPRTG